MSSKPQLIFDMGGVLVTNLTPPFWQDLADQYSIPYETLRAKYKQNVGATLWSGGISEEDFWLWLIREFPTIQIETAQKFLELNLKPLPAIKHLSKWSLHADIHILSNHRDEWLKPILKDIKESLKTVYVSSNIGISKPDVRIFEHVHASFNYKHKILFVDDKEKNLEEAAKLGWQVLLADEHGEWVEEVDVFLERNKNKT
ncbi:HAD family hydrolase [Chengkuizengella axinellae]|uniref:HAD-IA family hydrolase n=1 Tax=Chengkuizengella axinellae TaxID=3064388 RepID=A0ABT9J234_9BACL|nr:HAD-IA family hydrolase [Chengkuizengella sp. 2205SS18-9]MDP5275645.1 HAD-IA family hydrolase [Chengkuizengella sp. 2205SS18-9]